MKLGSALISLGTILSATAVLGGKVETSFRGANKQAVEVAPAATVEEAPVAAAPVANNALAPAEMWYEGGCAKPENFIPGTTSFAMTIEPIHEACKLTSIKVRRAETDLHICALKTNALHSFPAIRSTRVASLSLRSSQLR